MKNFMLHFALLLAISTQCIIAQNYSTGVIELSSSQNYTAQIDVTASEVTLTLAGPEGRWLGLGIGVNSMTVGGDTVIFDGTNMSDRAFIGIGATPPLDTNQDWTVTSDMVANDIRTIIATRALDTGEAEDYVFSAENGEINFVWALGSSYGISQHTAFGFAPMIDLTLGIEELFASEFKMYPNPATDIVRLDLPLEITSGDITVMDYTGKAILTTPIDNLNKTLDVSSLQSGVYLLNFETQQGKVARKLLID